MPKNNNDGHRVSSHGEDRYGKIWRWKRENECEKRERRGGRTVRCIRCRPETGRRAWANFHMRCCEFVTPWRPGTIPPWNIKFRKKRTLNISSLFFFSSSSSSSQQSTTSVGHNYLVKYRRQYKTLSFTLFAGAFLTRRHRRRRRRHFRFNPLLFSIRVHHRVRNVNKIDVDVAFF